MSIWIDNMDKFFFKWCNSIIKIHFHWWVEFIHVAQPHGQFYPWTHLSMLLSSHVLPFIIRVVNFLKMVILIHKVDLHLYLRFIHVMNSIQIRRFFHQHVAILLICFICVKLQFSIWLWLSQREGIFVLSPFQYSELISI